MGEKGLTTRQTQALGLMMAGMGDGEVAQAVGVTRQTVNTWRNKDAGFRAALETRGETVREAQVETLKGLVTLAAGVLREAMVSGTAGQRIKAAMFVLKMSGLAGFAQGEQARAMTEEEMFVTVFESALAEFGPMRGKKIGG